MTNDKIKALDTLIAVVESGSIMSTDARSVCHCLGWKFPDMRTKWLLSAEIGSLDAAKALHDTLLPGWTWTRWPQGDIEVCKDGCEFYIGQSFDPARAWLIAILKAYRAQMEAS